MKLTDIAPEEKWVELEEEINRRSGLDANVFNVEGYRISECKNWANKLCPAIKATDKGQSFICAPAHMNIAAQAMRTKKTVIEECDAGLVKMVVPVFIADEFVGAIGACGFLLDDGEIDTFLINKMTGIDEEEIERLSEGMPAITTAEAESLSNYITGQIEKLISNRTG
ncbi:MAG: PocR ligand-binding domain-containing protein [Desulfobacteraceae bacterium]|jgi:ligand-binding sensor protein|nr:PocR ligand-binding domain-containing protein [Desulfobacteraceae bacterium]